eukprot:14004559-Alexandrium_andersonii.AAC.1
MPLLLRPPQPPLPPGARDAVATLPSACPLVARRGSAPPKSPASQLALPRTQPVLREVGRPRCQQG